ncbi:MAG: hypothetical protein QXO16_05215 [Archaeoglobaceae archaeon]
MKVWIAVALIVAVFAISLAIISKESQASMPSPKGGEYLYFKGRESKIFLINSSMSYGTYGSVSWPWASAKKGDRCVVIGGTVRNDYDRDLWLCLTAEIYNTKGEKVGVVLLPNYPKGFTVVHVKSNDTSGFEIYIKYDKRDVADYKVYLTCVSEIPPP